MENTDYNPDPNSVTEQRRSIQEYRIDFLLEEEFACNIDFLRSFVSQCGLECEPQSVLKVVHESRHGSTWIDLLVVFKAIRATQEVVQLALLVEDKITAPPQPYQAKRYKEAGDAGLGEDWDGFRTVLVAPLSYQGEKEEFQVFIALQDVAAWLSPHDPIRADFRRDKITQAIEKKSKSGVQNPDSIMTEFKVRYYHHIQKFNEENGTGFFMLPPKNKHDSGDTWNTFTSQSLPEWCAFRHRIRTSIKDKTGLVGIAFRDTSFSKVETAFQALPESMHLLANGRDGRHTAIEIQVPEIIGVPNFDSVVNEVESALTAAKRLWLYVKDRWPSLEAILLAARVK